MLVTQGQTPVQFSCKYLQGTEETEPSPNQLCHSPTGHSPRSIWQPDWKTALQNLGSFMKFFASEKNPLFLAQVLLRDWLKSTFSLLTPTQNSTIRARMGNTSLVLCRKRTTVGLFNREIVTARAHIRQEKPAQGHAWWPCWPLQQFPPSKAIQSDRTVQGRLVRAALQYCRNSQASFLYFLLLSTGAADSSPPLSGASSYLSSQCLLPNPSRFDKLLILHRFWEGRSAHFTLSQGILTYRRYRWD